MIKKNLIFPVIIFILIFLMLYPSFFTYSDENIMVQGTYHLMNGNLVLDNVYKSQDYDFRNDHFIPKYPLGNILLMFPFAIFGLSGFFLMNLFFHVINYFLIILILKLKKLNPSYAILYLFFPSFVFASRTVMSEIPSIFFILLGYYFYQFKDFKSNYYSGFFLSVSLLIRYTNLIFIWPFFLVSLFKNYKKFLRMVISSLPASLFILAFNYFVYGAFFMTGYTSKQLILALDYSVVIKLVITYFWSNNLLYPLMLILVILFAEDFEVKLSIISALIIFSLLGVSPFHYDWIRNVLLGNRYMFPIIPLMLVNYFSLLNKSKFLKKLFIDFYIFFLTLLILSCILISTIQLSYNNQSLAISNNIYDNTLPGELLVVKSFGSKFLNPFIEQKNIINLDLNSEFTLPEKYVAISVNQGINDPFLHQDSDLVEFYKLLQENVGKLIIRGNGYKIIFLRNV